MGLVFVKWYVEDGILGKKYKKSQKFPFFVIKYELRPQ